VLSLSCQTNSPLTRTPLIFVLKSRRQVYGFDNVTTTP